MAKNRPHFGEFKGVTDFVSATLEREGDLGSIYEDGKGGVFQLVKLDATADAAAVAKDLVFWHTASKFTVTTTEGEAQGGQNDPAGVALVAVPVSSYFWMKVRGFQSVKAGAGTFAADIQVIPSTANDVVPLATATTAPTRKVVGLGTAASAGGFADIILQLDPAGARW